MLFAKNLVTDSSVIDRFFDKYLYTETDLPDTPQWEGTHWNRVFEIAKDGGKQFIISMQSGIIYKVKNEDAVENVSKLLSFGEMKNVAFNARTRRCFRLAWFASDKRSYVQYFSPVSHGMELFTMLDNDNGGTTLPLKPFLMLKDEEDMFRPYEPTTEDVLAEDWIVDGFNISELRDEVVAELLNRGCEIVNINNLVETSVQPDREIECKNS